MLDNSYTKYMLNSLTFAIPSLIIGLIIDQIFTRIQNEWGINMPKKVANIVFGLTQLLTMSTIVYILEKYIDISKWNNSIHGLLLASLYYGVHINMISNFDQLLYF